MKNTFKNILVNIFLIFLAIIATLIKAFLYITFVLTLLIAFPFIALINFLFKKSITKNTLFDDDCKANEIIANIIEFPEELGGDISFWLHSKI